MTRIIDLHCDTAQVLQAGIDISTQDAQVNCTLPGMHSGGVGIQVFACFVSSMIPLDRAFAEAMDLISHVRKLCADPANNLELILSAQQADDVLKSGRTGVVLAVENGHCLGEDPDRLETFFDQGVRYMTLTHASHLSWAASSGEDWQQQYGLTSTGENIIAKMNELGMIVDVSHVHDSTFWQVLKISRKPVIASHSNCRQICNTPRNLSDDQIKALAGQGGMMGINFFPGFLDSDFLTYQRAHSKDLFRQLDEVEKKHLNDNRKKYSAMQEHYSELRQRMQAVKVSPARIVDHIAHVVSLVGDEYVGFGSDFDGVPVLPDGISGCADLPVIIDLVRRRGFSESAIKNICSANFLRVWHENES